MEYQIKGYMDKVRIGNVGPAKIVTIFPGNEGEYRNMIVGFGSEFRGIIVMRGIRPADDGLTYEERYAAIEEIARKNQANGQ